MHLNLVLLFHSIAAGISGFLLLVVPSQLAALLLVPPSDMTNIAIDFARFYAASLILIALLTFSTRVSPSKYSRGLVTKSLLALQIVGLLVAFMLHYWLIKIIAIVSYALFAVLYLYILWFREIDIEGPYPEP